MIFRMHLILIILLVFQVLSHYSNHEYQINLTTIYISIQLIFLIFFFILLFENLNLYYYFFLPLEGFYDGIPTLSTTYFNSPLSFNKIELKCIFCQFITF